LFIETKDWSSFLTGERVLNYGTENMATMIVVNSHLETLTAALKNFLSLSAPYKHLIYAGHFFSGNGAWVLQDDTFSISNFAEMCKDKELEEAMKQQNGGTCKKRRPILSFNEQLVYFTILNSLKKGGKVLWLSDRLSINK
jgi:hypothetical protein